MIGLYPDLSRSDERGLIEFVEEADAYTSSLFDMARDLLGWYPLYLGWCEAYAAFAENYLHALRLDVLEATRMRDAFRLSQLIEDVEEVLRELQRRVNEPVRAA